MTFDPSRMTPAEKEAWYLAMRPRMDRIAVAGGPAVLGEWLDPTGYVRRPHLDVISQTYLDIRDGLIDRVSISLPPQTGKSRTAACWGAFWWLVDHPTDRVAIASYGDALAVSHGRFVRDLVKAYGRRFGLILDRTRSAAHDWRLTTGGGVRSVGVQTSLTGHPVEGLLIIDDVHKDRQEADSRLIRDRVGDWYSSTAYSRLAPGAAIILIGTRWHQDDLIGRVVAHEPDRWRTIVMPALCRDPETDPLQRPSGAPLPHPRVPLDDVAGALAHWENMRAGMTPRDWGSLAGCDPSPPEGALLTYSLLRARRDFLWDERGVKPVKAAVAVDPSGGGRDTAGIIGGQLGDDERLYITHDRSGRMAASDWGRAACILAEEIDADTIIVETNYGGDQATTIIRTSWNALANDPDDPEIRKRFRKRLCPRIKAVRARKNKRLRADPVAQSWIEDRIRTGAYLPEFEEEWATWNDDNSDSPGRIDASVYLAYGLLKLPGSGTKAASPAGISRSQIANRRAGTGILSATGYPGG